MTADIKLSENATCLKVSGTLNVETVAGLRTAGTQLAQTAHEPLFDLQNITQYDSSALALLTAWARDAKKAGKQARFINVPPQLIAIAKLSDLDKVLSLS